MSKKRSVAYVVMGIEFYVEIEKDGDMGGRARRHCQR
jgi:hypothetical protein